MKPSEMLVTFEVKQLALKHVLLGNKDISTLSSINETGRRHHVNVIKPMHYSNNFNGHI